MKLASLKHGRDGRLIVVSRDGQRYAEAKAAPTLQAALDAWAKVEPRPCATRAARWRQWANGWSSPARRPFPRAYEWVDGSANLNHILLVRKARGAEPPPGLTTDPLVYQGGGFGGDARAPGRSGAPRRELGDGLRIRGLRDPRRRAPARAPRRPRRT